jgi:hypothetical protein
MANAPLRLLAYGDILAEPLPPIHWLVNPLIASGDRVIVFGEYGSYKSWLLLDLSLHLAAEKPWLDQFSIPHPCPVLYVDGEMNERTLRRRIQRLGQGVGFGADLPFRALPHRGTRFASPEVAQRLLRDLQTVGYDPAVIILESLRRFLVGSENEAEAVGAFWDAVDPILQAGKTLIVSHHMRKPSPKGSNESRHRASGSTDILAGSDASFAVLKEPTGDILIECTKTREAEQPDSFLVSLEDSGPDSPARMVFRGFAGDSFGEQERAEALIIAFLAKAPDGAAKTCDIHAHTAAQGISLSTSERALRALQRTGQLRSVAHGHWQLVGGPQAS